MFAAGFQQTGAYRCPDSNSKRSDTHHKHDGENSHLSLVVLIVGLDVIKVKVRVARGDLGDANAVRYDDYPTKHGRGNRETHENASLKKKKNYKYE